MPTATPTPPVVFALWHSYTATINGYEEVEFPRLLGVYLSSDDAAEALRRASQKQGFDGDLPASYTHAGLTIETHILGDIAWRGGFFSVDESGREE